MQLFIDGDNDFIQMRLACLPEINLCSAFFKVFKENLKYSFTNQKDEIQIKLKRKLRQF